MEAVLAQQLEAAVTGRIVSLENKVAEAYKLMTEMHAEVARLMAALQSSETTIALLEADRQQLEEEKDFWYKEAARLQAHVDDLAAEDDDDDDDDGGEEGEDAMVQ